MRAAREEYARETAGEATDAERGIGEHDPRRAKIQALIDRAGTEGERDAAVAALARLDQDAADEADYIDALAHGAA